MPALRTLSGAQVRAILEAHGFAFVSQNGSHMKLRLTIVNDDQTQTTRTVIVPAHRAVQTGTLTSIIRQSGIGRKPFEV